MSVLSSSYSKVMHLNPVTVSKSGNMFLQRLPLVLWQHYLNSASLAQFSIKKTTPELLTPRWFYLGQSHLPSLIPALRYHAEEQH